MLMKKKVSVIVPVYNSEGFLEKLILSVLSQTYENWELILVDDGSPDNSGRICDEYVKSDERIYVIHQENKGCCEARNVGIKRATGEYIMFADGDDWLEIDCIEYLINLAQKNGCQMAMTDIVVNSHDIIAKEDSVKVLTSEEAACFILYVKTPVGPWNKLYSTEVIKKNNISFDVPWFGEGLYFSVMNSQLSNKVVVGHRAVYHYRLDNATSGTTIRKVEHGINALWNIRNIRDHLIVRTDRTVKAATWHLHRNCFNLLWFILGSSEKEKYANLYRKTRKELLELTPQVFLQSEISIAQKGLVLLIGLCPRIAARFATWRRNWKLKKA